METNKTIIEMLKSDIKGDVANAVNALKRYLIAEEMLSRTVTLLFPWDFVVQANNVSVYLSICSTYIDIYFPRDMRKIVQLRESLIVNGWQYEEQSEGSNIGDIIYTYTKTLENIHPDSNVWHLRLIADADRQGATCIIKQISTKTETVVKPVYEVICPEGNAEMEEVNND